MTEYVVERHIAAPPAEVWAVLADLGHFAVRDPYHHDLAFVGPRRGGVGARFTIRDSADVLVFEICSASHSVRGLDESTQKSSKVAR